MDGIFFVLRTGSQRNDLPKEFDSGSAAHRRFQQWVNQGVFQEAWVKLLKKYDERGRIKWKWQSVPRFQLGKGPFWGKNSGPNPTDRGKLGTKRHIVTDQRVTPLSAVITSANTHDVKAAFETLDGTVVERPEPRRHHPQRLCLDKGYDFQEIEFRVIQRRYIQHMRHRGEIEYPAKRYKPRRWVVERSASWLSRFRMLLIRWVKKAENCLALVQLACCIMVYRRTVLG